MDSIKSAWDYFGEEKPIVFFDTYPGPAPSFVWASWDRFRRHITTAWTGVPDLDVSPGQLRLFWVTTDGKEGKRDYELKDYEEVRLGFEKLFTLDEVSRAMVIGYASQNPYSIYGKSEWQQQQEERKKMLEAQYRDFVPKKARKENVGAEIDMILDEEDKRAAKKGQEMGGQDV